MTGVYVHLPFCPYICPYCDFAKWPYKASSAARYVQALAAEIAASEPCYAGSVYLGGGTPNMYDTAAVAALLAHLRRNFPGPLNRETTIETNPELLDLAALKAYVASGVTRLSIGVQSFVDSEIRTLGRHHSAEQVKTAVKAARAAGIQSVSLDLIFGVPEQTPQAWRESLAAAVSLDPDHISTYGLTIEPGTPYAKLYETERSHFIDDDAQAELYAIAMDVLGTAGFEHYEISNFARPGHRCIHNVNYWTNGEYVGLGVGAASYCGGVRSVHTRDLETYITSVMEHREIPQESERLEGARRAGEAVMLALRTSQGVSFAAFRERYGLEFLATYAPIVDSYRAAGFLDVTPAGARLTKRGRFVANEICAAFVTVP
ncbi:MAG TPA: radical SAM family heme chaperone HemW [Candidatus Rubrimentiphilum sp.]|nr:radical SAM family heme chaperone HemW [Candidatus Rubrimentiphilum sp.]